MLPLIVIIVALFTGSLWASPPDGLPNTLYVEVADSADAGTITGLQTLEWAEPYQAWLGPNPTTQDYASIQYGGPNDYYLSLWSANGNDEWHTFQLIIDGSTFSLGFTYVGDPEAITYIGTEPPSSVPEPGTAFFALAALGGMLLRRAC